MPTTTINQLPIPASISLDDLVAIDQENNGVYTTYQATVRQLLALGNPEPTITNLVWDGGITLLQIEGENLLPNTLVFVDDVPYKFDTFLYASLPNPTNSATLELGLYGLATGTHTVKVINGINEATDTFTS